MRLVETSAFNIQVPETTVRTAHLQPEQEFSCRSGRRLVGCLPLSSRAGYRASKGKGSNGTGTGACGCESRLYLGAREEKRRGTRRWEREDNCLPGEADGESEGWWKEGFEGIAQTEGTENWWLGSTFGSRVWHGGAASRASQAGERGVRSSNRREVMVWARGTGVGQRQEGGDGAGHPRSLDRAWAGALGDVNPGLFPVTSFPQEAGRSPPLRPHPFPPAAASRCQAGLLPCLSDLLSYSMEQKSVW